MFPGLRFFFDDKLHRRQRKLAQAIVFVIFELLVAGCATAPTLPNPPEIDATSLIWPNNAREHALDDTPDMVEILSLTPQMQAFVKSTVHPSASADARLRQLMQGMISNGYFDVEYAHDQTLSAAQTFESREGNCLAFTILFVALAREARLPVKFQLVDIPPQWHFQQDWVVLDKHVNAVLPGIRINGIYTRDFVVDFNISDYRGNYPRRSITDAQALARFYNNLGVAAMQQHQQDKAFALFSEAHDLDPRMPGLWINLGTLFAKRAQLAFAEAALHQALSIESGNPAALSNLAELYAAQGLVTKQAQVEAVLRRARLRNPYFFYQDAEQAWQAGRYQYALESLQQAIRLKNDEHQFYFLKAKILESSNAPQNAERAVLRALKLSKDDPKLNRAYRQYIRKLQRLPMDN